MAKDIVIQLSELAKKLGRLGGSSTISGAIYEIKRLRDSNSGIAAAPNTDLKSVQKGNQENDVLDKLMHRAKFCNHGLVPPYPEGAEVHIGPDCFRCRLDIEAANEIDRLRSIICDYYWAERDYQIIYDCDYEDVDEFGDVIAISDAWKSSWSSLENEAIKHNRKYD